MLNIIDIEMTTDTIPVGQHRFAGGMRCFCTIVTDYPINIGSTFDVDDGFRTLYGVTPTSCQVDRVEYFNGPQHTYTYKCLFDHVMLSTPREVKKDKPTVDLWNSWDEFCRRDA